MHQTNGSARWTSEQQAQDHYHYHWHQTAQGPKVKVMAQLHPLDNGKNWLIGLSFSFVAVLVAIILAFVLFSGKSNSAAPPTVEKEVAPVKPAAVEKAAPPANKASHNGGKSKNVNIEGNNNKVSQNTTHNTTVNQVVVNETVVVKETTKVVVVEKPAERVVVVVKARGNDHCDDEAARHELVVARWKTIFPAQR